MILMPIWNVPTVIVFAIVMVLLVLAVRKLVKDAKQGNFGCGTGCSGGCCGGCSGCHGCSACHSK